MRLWSVPPLLLALLWFFSSVAAVHAADDDPGAIYFQVYSAYKQGETFEQSGKLDDALQKFRVCVSLLVQMQKDSPDYNPALVEFRLKKSRASIARVQSMQSPLAGAEAVVPFPATPQPPGSVFAQVTVPYRTAPGGAPSTLPGNRGDVMDIADEVIGRGALRALKDQIRSLQAQLDQQTRINAGLNDRLLESTAREQSALTDVDRTRVKVVEVESLLTQMRQSNEDLQVAIDRLSKEKAFDERRIDSLESSLADARADIEVADEQNSELFTKLEAAGKFIEAGEKIRKELLEERKVLAAKAGDRSAGLAKIQKERDAAIAERDALRKKVEDATAMAKENKTIASKLASAEKQIAEFSKDTGERDKAEQSLRAEVESVNKSLAALRDQLKTGQSRIAELEKQLTDTAGATTLVTGAMADENALLKSIILRELQDQAKRQQARKLVEEELEKLQVRSTTLLDKVAALGAAETVLSPREKKIANVPSTAIAADQSDFTVVKPMPESDLPPELVARAAQANELSQKRKFDEARGIYEEIAKKAPQSYLAAVNLGIAQRQMGDYEQAITAFRRALELKSGDPFALTNLGTAEYRAGNLTEAVDVLQKAVAADEESYLAHYLLGMALNDRGDREGARREIKKSLAIKPDYVPAVELGGELEEDFGENSTAKPAR
jgi:tetratricopeptide (TPR) repeat protein